MINGEGLGRLGTAEVAARLGVKPETVYAYASRGLLHPRRGPHGSTYDPAEVERVARTTRSGDRAGRSARDLAFVTRLTLIEGGHLSYRGRDTVELSRRHSFEEVAWFLWTGDLAEQPVWSAPPPFLQVARASVAALGDLGRPIDRLRVAVAAAAVADPLRHDRSPSAVAGTGRSMLAAMVDSLPVVGQTDAAPGDHLDLALPRDHLDLALPQDQQDLASPPRDQLEARLWDRLAEQPSTPGRLAALRVALVLIADHELAASTLAARVAASFRADPYAVVGAGLGPAGGPLHSGASAEVRDLLTEAAASGPERAVGRLLDRDLRLPGFGLPLYPDGDPRAAELLALLPQTQMDPGRAGVIEAVLALGVRQGAPPPNIDFALGALEWGLDLIGGAGQALFVVGRSAGWLAHAIEEYEQRNAFRVRAAYIGPR